MDNGKFVNLAKNCVVSYLVELEDYPEITHDDIYVVWICKTLQNNKALLATNHSGDGFYFEVTYNGDKNEVYFDAYKKVVNKCFDVIK